MLGRSAWPSPLTAMFWAIVPLWFVIHAFAAVLAETRLLLVPYAPWAQRGPPFCVGVAVLCAS